MNSTSTLPAVSGQRNHVTLPIERPKNGGFLVRQEQSSNYKAREERVFTNLKEIDWDIGKLFSGNGAESTFGFGEQFVVYVKHDDNEKHITFCYSSTLDKEKRIGIKIEFREDTGYQLQGKYTETDITVSPSLVRALAADAHENWTSNDDDQESIMLERFMETVADAESRKGRSDIHFEISRIPHRTKTRVRIDGDLNDHRNFDYSDLLQMVRTAYNVIGARTSDGCTIQGSELDIKQPQDAKLVFFYKSKKYSLRVSTLPRSIEEGLDFTCRFLDDEAKGETLKVDELGYASGQSTQITKALKKPSGIILFVGVTGSGKSVSMVACAQFLVDYYEGKKKIIFVENPVERIIPGVTHVNIEENYSDSNEDLSVEKQMLHVSKKTMRSDPDIISVGEIRCYDTASFATSSAITGHLCLSTIHVAEAPMVPSRFDNWNVSRKVVGLDGLVNVIVAQTLVPVVCPDCSVTPESMDPLSPDLHELMDVLDELQLLEHLPNIRFANQSGCINCNFTGRKGRTLVAEVLTPTREINNCWRNGEDAQATKLWYLDGGYSRLEHGIAKMIKGIIDPAIVSQLGDPLDSIKIRKTMGVPLFTGDV
ncbi:hypothetical protein FG475_15235 [Vibrio navarrensis]|nr:hypothetical protein [Vibrio navarrensis]HDY8121382.1 Flp pilus assembly complex ATPase component TadA [Vibrio vulnificus]